MSLRLLPVVLIATTSLLVLKLAGLLFLGGFALPPIGPTPALAQTEPVPPPADPAAAAPVEAPPAAPAEAPAAQAAEYKTQEQPLPPDRQGRIVQPGEVSGAKAAVLQRLGERSRELDEREKALDLRENLMKAAEQRVSARVAELKEIEARIQATVEKREAEQKAQLKGLVTMYESMKPKDAARIFSKLTLNVLVDLVEQMNARKMADILAAMDSAAAQRLTLEIANRGRQKAFPVPAESLPKIEGTEPNS